MSINVISTILATLALVALVGAVTLIFGHFTGRRWLARERGLLVAWLIATVSVSGSLYYSEVAGFIPCDLCWWQRIAMYPLVVVLGLAVRAGDRSVRRYVLPVALAGGGVSLYHSVLQRYPTLFGSSCSFDAPCTGIWVDTFGFVTIPFMAMGGFVAIAVLMFIQEKP